MKNKKKQQKQNSKFKFSVGSILNLKCLKENPSVKVEKIDNLTAEGNAFFKFKNKKCFSPLTSVYCNNEGWYALEIYEVK